MNFYYWLLSQNRRDDAVGDLARDAMLDKDWPRDKPDANPNANPNQVYRRCRQYLALMAGDSSPAMDALDQAVAEHQAHRAAPEQTAPEESL